MSILNLALAAFRCCSCGEDSERPAFPLCAACAACLAGSLPCEPRLGDPVDACFCLYLLNDGNYAILRTWKKRRGPLFDRRVLGRDRIQAARSWLSRAEAMPSAVVPIPQDPVRSLRMGGSPALRIAGWAANSLLGSGGTLQELLQKAPQEARFARSLRQAELDFWHRLQSPLEFELAPGQGPPPACVLLVDDFITTGHTAREAARALKRSGVRSVLVLGLGARACGSEQELSLLKGA